MKNYNNFPTNPNNGAIPTPTSFEGSNEITDQDAINIVDARNARAITEPIPVIKRALQNGDPGLIPLPERPVIRPQDPKAFYNAVSAQGNRARKDRIGEAMVTPAERVQAAVRAVGHEAIPLSGVVSQPDSAPQVRMFSAQGFDAKRTNIVASPQRPTLQETTGVDLAALNRELAEAQEREIDARRIPGQAVSLPRVIRSAGDTPAWIRNQRNPQGAGKRGGLDVNP